MTDSSTSRRFTVARSRLQYRSDYGRAIYRLRRGRGLCLRADCRAAPGVPSANNDAFALQCGAGIPYSVRNTKIDGNGSRNLVPTRAREFNVSNVKARPVWSVGYPKNVVRQFVSTRRTREPTGFSNVKNQRRNTEKPSDLYDTFGSGVDVGFTSGPSNVSDRP